jgi:hypothetical protein
MLVFSLLRAHTHISGKLPLHLNGTVDAGYSVAHHSFFVGFDIELACRS